MLRGVFERTGGLRTLLCYAALLTGVFTLSLGLHFVFESGSSRALADPVPGVWVAESGSVSLPVPPRRPQEPPRSAAPGSGDFIAELQNLSRQRTLTREDIRPVWQTLRIDSRPADLSARESMELCRQLNALPVSPADKLETIRRFGQFEYLRGHYELAGNIFSFVWPELDRLSREDRRQSADTIGNILYLNGLVLKQLDRVEALIVNDEQIAGDPLLMQHAPAATCVGVYARLGRMYYDARRFGESMKIYETGLGVLDREQDLKHRYLIEFVVGQARAQVMEQNPDEPDHEALFGNLTEIRERYAGKGYPGFDHVLDALVEVARQQQNDERYVTALGELRDYYKSRYQTLGKWESREFDKFLDASVLLTRHHLAASERNAAIRFLMDTQQVAEPVMDWEQHFPPGLVNEVLTGVAGLAEEPTTLPVIQDDREPGGESAQVKK